MTTELKTVVILNGEIINVGEWDYQEQRVITNQNEIDAANKYNESVENEADYIEVPEPIFETRQQNPLPTGATTEEREMQYSEEFGWREVGWTPPMTLEQENKLLKLQNQANAERMEFMEDLIAEIAMKVYE